MARMGDIFGETVRDFEHGVQAAEDWFTYHPHAPHGHDPYASAATATETPTITPDTQEDPMSLLAELEADARALAAKFETVDKDALASLEAVQAHPAALDAFNTLAALVRSPVDATEGIGVAVSVLKMTLGVLAGQAQAAQPQYAPGPVVAGQA